MVGFDCVCDFEKRSDKPHPQTTTTTTQHDISNDSDEDDTELIWTGLNSVFAGFNQFDCKHTPSIGNEREFTSIARDDEKDTG